MHIEQLASSLNWKANKMMNEFIWTTCDTIVLTQSFTFQHHRNTAQTQQAKKSLLIYLFQRGKESKMPFLHILCQRNLEYAKSSKTKQT